MQDARKAKPVNRLDPCRVELVRPTHQPSTAELEDSITLLRMSLKEAARRLMKPVEIHQIDEPLSEN